MKFKNPLIVVKDMEKAKKFYKDVLGLRVIADFGANVTLTGGVCLQTYDSWKEFIGTDNITFGANCGEIYFEEDNFDAFAEKLEKIGGIKYVHLVKEHRWGQRVVRFYDEDMHIIEVGESLKNVCRRFEKRGMTEEEIAIRMDIPAAMVNRLLR